MISIWYHFTCNLPFIGLNFFVVPISMFVCTSCQANQLNFEENKFLIISQIELETTFTRLSWVCLLIYLFAYMLVCVLFVCFCVPLFDCLCTYLRAYLLFYLSAYFLLYLSASLIVNLHINFCLCLRECLLICLFSCFLLNAPCVWLKDIYTHSFSFRK